jgi:hypothetical protein
MIIRIRFKAKTPFVEAENHVYDPFAYAIRWIKSEHFLSQSSMNQHFVAINY